MDFFELYTKELKDKKEVCIDFKVYESKDIMFRGKAFYAIYNPSTGLWSTDEMAVAPIVDSLLWKEVESVKKTSDVPVVCKPMRKFNSGSWKTFVSYSNAMPDNWHRLDDTILFANDKLSRESYATKVLPYAREKGSIDSYNELMSVLYDPEERDKLEWAVGAVLAGDSKHIQKFITLYGSAGSGKSTFLNIVQKLVKGYYISFVAKDLVGHNSFATEAFKNNPLVAIQHDGDLSKIEDNSTLNSIISHEAIVINEKHKSQYSMALNCFLFLGTNKHVSIADTKSGLARRLIDVKPSGRKVSPEKYYHLTSQIDFELGAIADYCIKKYKKMGENYYEDYKPKEMIFATNVIYNFVMDNILIFDNGEEFQLRQLYDSYRKYCEEVGEKYPLPKKTFRGELLPYFKEFFEQTRLEDGRQARSVFKGFKGDIFNSSFGAKEEDNIWLHMDKTESLFDEAYSDIPAQYATKAGTPEHRWSNCTTKLKDLDTTQLHYVMGMEQKHIVIDFDIVNESGEKSLEKNLKEANKWPETYAELSKSGAGVHLHYIWAGPKVAELERLYSPGIEIKVFAGNSSLRRKLSWCNAKPIATLSSGLKYKEKGVNSVINKKTVEDEKHLRIMIKKCMNKEFHGSTKPECDFIFKLLDEAYKSGMIYDVSDMKSAVLAFAASSSNQASYCVGLLNKMKWCSEPIAVEKDNTTRDIVFYDVEVFKNLFLICYKIKGKDKKCVSLINPTPQEVEKLMDFKLIGFNNKRYDDHMLYARYIGYTNEQLYDLSSKLISKIGSVKNGFREASSIAYSDVYDFCSEKKSLKKWEIELGIAHQELECDFNEPLPEERWPKAIEYCCNDVIATEEVFNHQQADWSARLILAELADGNPNMTTNDLTTKIVFGEDRNPQLNYVNLEETFPGYSFERGEDNKMHNMYRETDVSFGGYVRGIPGMYFDVAVLDIKSMHPSSIIIMNYFGKYTYRYENLKIARIAIKDGNLDLARTMFDGKLAPYLDTEELLDKMAYALKIALNSAYGLTSASFPNIMKDPRNTNNIVALRGALFMRTLQDLVEARGFQAIHIKTDSIKIPNATPEIIEFCKDFALQYGYEFEHEATYEKMCLVNKAVYIAKYGWAAKKKLIGTWTATGAQFAEPFLFKTLFSKEPIEFGDYKQVKSVTNPALIYLDFNESNPEEHNYIHVGKVGSFVPVIDGVGGGLLIRRKEGHEGAITGTKGYRWKETELVRSLGNEDQVALSYFYNLVDYALSAIKVYGPLEDFMDDWYEAERREELIGFDDMPQEEVVAKAIVLKGP